MTYLVTNGIFTKEFKTIKEVAMYLGVIVKTVNKAIAKGIEVRGFTVDILEDD